MTRATSWRGPSWRRALPDGGPHLTRDAAGELARAAHATTELVDALGVPGRRSRAITNELGFRLLQVRLELGGAIDRFQGLGTWSDERAAPASEVSTRAAAVVAAIDHWLPRLRPSWPWQRVDLSMCEELRDAATALASSTRADGSGTSAVERLLPPG